MHGDIVRYIVLRPTWKKKNLHGIEKNTLQLFAVK